MARRVFFSYHFQEDAWRANQVRNSWVTKPSRQAAGFFDAAEQEKVKRATEAEIRKWIDAQLHGTSVTVVLIGEHTASRKYVRYEIERSFERGNAILGIRIHNLKDRHRQTCYPGDDPLQDYFVETPSGHVRLSDLFPTYDWFVDGGQENLPDWIEEAVKASEQLTNRSRAGLVHGPESPVESWPGVVLAGAAVVAGFVIGAAILEELARRFRQQRYW